jgi:hypothetical protein
MLLDSPSDMGKDFFSNQSLWIIVLEKMMPKQKMPTSSVGIFVFSFGMQSFPFNSDSIIQLKAVEIPNYTICSLQNLLSLDFKIYLLYTSEYTRNRSCT